MKKNSSVIVEITDVHVKLFKAKWVRGKRVISTCQVRALQHFTDEELTRILSEYVLSKDVREEDLWVVIPRRLAILKQMRLPSQNEAELKKMVGLQLVNKIPYALEDVVYDYHLLESEASGYTHVLAVVIHKDISDRYLNIFHKLGVGLKNLRVSSFGILDWLIHQENSKKLTLPETIGIINVDVAHTEICFCHNKRLLFSRFLNYGARDLNADNTVEMLHQVQLSLGTYQKENMGPAVGKMVILSTMNEAQPFKERLEQEIKMSVDVLSPFDNFLCQKKINLSSLKDQTGVSVTVGFGLINYERKKAINLMPQEVFDTEKLKKSKRELIQFIFLLCIAAILSVSVLAIDVYKRVSILEELEEKGVLLDSKIAKAEERIGFVRVFNDEFKDRIYITDLINELEKVTPNEISFRSLEMNERGQFTIQGYAQTSSAVNGFQSRLVKTPVFKEVNLKFATKRKIFNMDVTDFKIVFQVVQKKGDL